MILALAQICLAIVYPLIIWFGLARFEPRMLALLVLALAGLRFALGHGGGGARPSGAVLRDFGIPAVLIAASVGSVLIWNDAIGLLLMPVAISLAFLLTFGFSLISGPPMVERFARLQVEDLSTEEVVYCRRVTWIWCAFFVVNAMIAGLLGAARALDAWALYTGLISYLLMGMLFAGEYLYRHWRFRRYVGAFSDPILMRLFPPREGEATSVAGRGEGTNREVRAAPQVSPERLQCEGEGDTRRVIWQVPERLACWPGHFPEQSLLPGVLQLSWVMEELELWQGRDVALRRIDRLKFKLPVLPGDRLRVELSRQRAETTGWIFRVELFLRDASATTLQVVAEDAVGQERAEETTSLSERPSTESEWPSPSEILPHAGHMLWLDAIVGHDDGETLSRARTEGLGFFRHGSGEAGAWLALEWMAQTVAAHDGVRRHRAGLPIRPGMLLGTKRLEVFGGALAPDGEFEVRVRQVFGGESGMVSYDCEVHDANRAHSLRAKARLACRVGTPGAPLV